MTGIAILFTAVSLPARPNMPECLEFQFVGLIIVLTALAMLWLICELAGVAFRSTSVRQVQAIGGGEVFDDEAEQGAVDAAIVAAVHAVVGPGARIISATPVDRDPAVTAAVAAAVGVALGPGHRVRSVRVMPDPSRAAWAAEGRRQQFELRKVR